jgi:predicted metal-dependent hydrolase
MNSLKSEHIFQYGTKNIAYILLKSKRLKTSEVIVDDEKIIVRSPYNKSHSEIEDLLRMKINWIIKKQREIKEQGSKVEIIRPSFENNSTVPFLGRNLKLNIIYSYSRERDSIELKNNQLFVFISTKNKNMKNFDQKSETKAKLLYEKWIANNAGNVFKEKVLEFSKIIEVSPRKIVIKNLKNRWGSVSEGGTINLNVNLLKSPDQIIDYIIIHELCHFVIKGHSHKFWTYLHKFVPNYHDKINWLEVNGSSILN